MSKIKKNGGLDQYGHERFGRLILLQSEKCGTERVNFGDVSERHQRSFLTMFRGLAALAFTPRQLSS